MSLKDTVMRVRQYSFFNNTDGSEHILESYNYPMPTINFSQGQGLVKHERHI